MKEVILVYSTTQDSRDRRQAVHCNSSSQYALTWATNELVQQTLNKSKSLQILQNDVYKNEIDDIGRSAIQNSRDDKKRTIAVQTSSP